MYSDKITLFNRHVDDSTDTITWYPTVISGVNLVLDKAAIVAKYGSESQDNAILNVRYSKDSTTKAVLVDGKEWMSPKMWAHLNAEELLKSITFKSGEECDFFYVGEWESTEPIADADYKKGFYDHMNKNYDFVFVITSVSLYSVIPHFEIVGK